MLDKMFNLIMVESMDKFIITFYNSNATDDHNKVVKTTEQKYAKKGFEELFFKRSEKLSFVFVLNLSFSVEVLDTCNFEQKVIFNLAFLRVNTVFQEKNQV